MSLTPNEKQEYLNLKYIRCERGFFLPDETKRYNKLFDKNAQEFINKMKKIEETNRLIMSN